MKNLVTVLLHRESGQACHFLDVVWDMGQGTALVWLGAEDNRQTPSSMGWE